MIQLLEEQRNEAQDLELDSWQGPPKVKPHCFPGSQCSLWCKCGRAPSRTLPGTVNKTANSSMGQREDNKQQKQDSGQESQLGKPGREFALLVRCVQSALTSFCILFFFFHGMLRIIMKNSPTDALWCRSREVSRALEMQTSANLFIRSL